MIGNAVGKWISISSLDEDIFSEADAILILTEWKVYTNIDWIRVSEKMRRPAWLFDLRYNRPQKSRKYHS